MQCHNVGTPKDAFSIGVKKIRFPCQHLPWSNSKWFMFTKRILSSKNHSTRQLNFPDPNFMTCLIHRHQWIRFPNTTFNLDRSPPLGRILPSLFKLVCSPTWCVHRWGTNRRCFTPWSAKDEAPILYSLQLCYCINIGSGNDWVLELHCPVRILA